MSRFYQALKEASRSRQDAGGNGNREWEALGTNEGDIPPVPNEPEVSQTRAPVAVLADEPILVAPEEVIQSPQSGSCGTATRVVLDKKARLIPHAVDPSVLEHYRTLRTKILQQQAEKPFRSLVLTSASPQEGKTVTVLNLGLCFAMLPAFRVLVVDGDLRRGTLGNWLGMDNRDGLSNLIDGSAKLEEVVWKSDDNPMSFILRGNSKVSAAELLDPVQLKSHFRKMTEHFDLVLVDSPPVNLITDAQLLATSCDAVLLIARAFSTTRKSFEKAIQELRPFRVIGTVLNAGTARYSGYGYY